MKSVGQILGATLGKPALLSSDGPRAPRKHRVHLCSYTFATVEVTAATPDEAFEIANRQAAEAKLDFSTVLSAFRADVSKPVNYSDPSMGFKWVRLECDIGENGGWVWREGKDCRE